MIGVARKATIKSRESNFSPSGLNKPPAPSIKQNIKTFLHRADVREHLRQFYPLPFAARGQQRRDGRAEMPRIDFIERERAIHCGMKRPGVARARRSKWV